MSIRASLCYDRRAGQVTRCRRVDLHPGRLSSPLSPRPLPSLSPRPLPSSLVLSPHPSPTHILISFLIPSFSLRLFPSPSPLIPYSSKPFFLVLFFLLSLSSPSLASSVTLSAVRLTTLPSSPLIFILFSLTPSSAYSLTFVILALPFPSLSPFALSSRFPLLSPHVSPTPLVIVLSRRSLPSPPPSASPFVLSPHPVL